MSLLTGLLLQKTTMTSSCINLNLHTIDVSNFYNWKKFIAGQTNVNWQYHHHSSSSFDKTQSLWFWCS